MLLALLHAALRKPDAGNEAFLPICESGKKAATRPRRHPKWAASQPAHGAQINERAPKHQHSSRLRVPKVCRRQFRPLSAQLTPPVLLLVRATQQP